MSTTLTLAADVVDSLFVLLSLLLFVDEQPAQQQKFFLLISSYFPPYLVFNDIIKDTIISNRVNNLSQ